MHQPREVGCRRQVGTYARKNAPLVVCGPKILSTKVQRGPRQFPMSQCPVPSSQCPMDFYRLPTLNASSPQLRHAPVSSARQPPTIQHPHTLTPPALHSNVQHPQIRRRRRTGNDSPQPGSPRTSRDRRSQSPAESRPSGSRGPDRRRGSRPAGRRGGSPGTRSSCVSAHAGGGVGGEVSNVEMWDVDVREAVVRRGRAEMGANDGPGQFMMAR